MKNKNIDLGFRNKNNKVSQIDYKNESNKIFYAIQGQPNKEQNFTCT